MSEEATNRHLTNSADNIRDKDEKRFITSDVEPLDPVIRHYNFRVVYGRYDFVLIYAISFVILFVLLIFCSVLAT